MALGIGDELRAARREQNRSLSDAADQTRIRETYLAALEDEEFAALGGDVYVKGFLRSYAKYLGLDPDPLVETYRREHERNEPDPPSLGPASRPAFPGPGDRPSALVVVGGVVVAVLALLVVIGLLNGGGETAGQDVPPVASSSPTPAVTPSATSAAAPTTPSRRPSATPSASPSPFTELAVAIEVGPGPSWMRVTVDGEQELEGPQDAGTELSYDAQESVLLRLGDAAQVRVSINGADQGDLGDAGDVVVLDCQVGATCERTVVEG